MTRGAVLDALDRVLEASPPWTRESRTSFGAAMRQLPRLPSKRIQVAVYFAAIYPNAVTDEEGSIETGLYRYTFAPRRGELVQAGLVVEEGERAGVAHPDYKATAWRATKELADVLLRAEQPSFFERTA